MKNKINELYALEQLSKGDTYIHRLHPAVKLITTVVFILTAISFDRYALGKLVPFVFYPSLLMAFSETPYSMLLKRLALALPFCFFAGLSNVIFDSAPALTIGSVPVSFGIISFATLLLRTYLCVMAVLILVAVTPFSELTNEMRRFGLPAIFVVMFEMTYRYIGVLLGEAHSMYIAYSLRNGSGKGIDMKDMGSFLGQLLLRSFDRADRVYSAMKCRGYALQSLNVNSKNLSRGDLVYLAAMVLLCIALRFVDVNGLLIRFAGGLNA